MPNINQQLRQAIQRKRQQLSQHAQQQAAQAVMAQVIELDSYQNSQHIACYIAHHGECDPSATVQQAWRDGKQCYVPVVGPEHSMVFVAYNADTPLTNNRYGIAEPTNTTHPITPSRLDMALIPMVAFNRNLYRLGMGGGYYDRYFATQPAAKTLQLVGLAYSWQASDDWQCQDWDLRCDQVITAETNSR